MCGLSLSTVHPRCRVQLIIICTWRLKTAGDRTPTDRPTDVGLYWTVCARCSYICSWALLLLVSVIITVRSNGKYIYAPDRYWEEKRRSSRLIFFNCFKAERRIIIVKKNARKEGSYRSAREGEKERERSLRWNNHQRGRRGGGEGRWWWCRTDGRSVGRWIV